jgi:hypothetical protein
MLLKESLRTSRGDQMKRKGSCVLMCFVLAPAVLGVFVAGLQQARAVDCMVCECLEENYWAVDLGAGVQVTGARVPTTNTLCDHALKSVTTAQPATTCRANPTLDNGLMDLRRFTECGKICDVIGEPNPWAMWCTDNGTVVASNAQRLKCSDPPP